MRLRLEHLQLVGTSREIDFEPGLNLIVGTISTGKTSLMRLLSVLLGSKYSGITPEVDRTVTRVAAEVVIGETTYSIHRPLVQTDTAKVDVAGGGEALRLPARQPDEGYPVTYGTWLLERLGLPDLRIPTAPTRPAESATTPVSIADYMQYCQLKQDEIDIDILGATEWFTDYKRRAVFRILYGTYDARVAQLQDELRAVESELRQLRQGRSALERVLENSAFENRAEIEEALHAWEHRVEELRSSRRDIRDEARTSDTAVRLNDRLVELDKAIADLAAQRDRELSSADDLRELRNELESQAVRLTKAIVAGERLFDFDFLLCPRCGLRLGRSRVDEQHCYLCLQPLGETTTPEQLVGELDRVNAQILETDELTAAHTRRALSIDAKLVVARDDRVRIGQDLDRHLEGFISDRVEALEQEAAALAEAEANVNRYRDYASLLGRLESNEQRLSELEARRRDIDLELANAERLDSATAARMERLEAWFKGFIEAFEVPRFGDGIRAAIDQTNFLPIVNSRHFDELSAGVRVLVNIAYALAHHRTALELSLPLPNLLLIDGIHKNIGTAEYDAARTEDVWRVLQELHAEFAEDFQLIVAANDIPEYLSDHVRLHLSDDNRLIPEQDLLGDD
ncbi:MAG TPA: AAA family ATPase [Actinomycetota bacterium]|nr:AAA family ATPase [Actinomycetota bacterium]